MAAPDPKSLTREQLSAFLPNQESIRRFERLFEQAGTLTPAQIAILYQRIQEVLVDAGIAGARAGEAIDSLLRIERDVETSSMSAESSAVAAADSMRRIAQALEVIASRPQAETPRSFQVDYIDFLNSPHAEKVRRVAWDDDDDTLNVGHSGGVTQQVGLESYTRFNNGTGVTIPNGTAVGLDYVGGMTTDNIVPYLADGTVPVLNIIGVATQDIAPGEYGRATIHGRVRGIDTTGAPYGETWAQGDVLYPSPLVAGELTNMKPTAPEACIPIAIVVVIDAVDGAIQVRPTIEQEENFGVFSDSTSQPIVAAYTPQAVTFSTEDFARGITIGSPSSRIVSASSGLYDFQFSLQLTSGSASVKTLYVWARINGSDMQNSLGEVTISGSGTTVVLAWNYVFSMEPGDYFELMIAGDSTNLELTFNAAQAGANGTATFARPATPSAILSVTHVAQ